MDTPAFSFYYVMMDACREIVRAGNPRCLLEGTFRRRESTEDYEEKTRDHSIRKVTKAGHSFRMHTDSERDLEVARTSLLLDCGVELKIYSLVTDCELTGDEIKDRANPITSAPVPYDPTVDLVKADLAVVPAVIMAIDRGECFCNHIRSGHGCKICPSLSFLDCVIRCSINAITWVLAWSNKDSIERITGDSFARNLVLCMKNRMMNNKNTIDLLVAGIEASLWIGEQWAADLRMVFPQLNIVTVSANK
jgi:hypothetical protein